MRSRPSRADRHHADQVHHTGRCYTILSRHELANRWHDQGFKLRPLDPGVNIDHTIRTMFYAETVLSLGDVEHACALASQAVPSVAVARTERHRGYLARLHTRLNQHHDVPAVTALDEQIRTLIPSAA